MKHVYTALKVTIICFTFILLHPPLQGQCWKVVAQGSTAYHTVAIAQNGSLWAWGYNNYGKLGDGTTINRISPFQIGNATNWLYVTIGGDYTVAIRTDGTLWAWGFNQFGQLGDGSTSNKMSPAQIGTATNWLSVSAGQQHTIAIKKNGTLWAWGLNFYGQLGNGTTANETSPVQIGTATNWLSVSAGNNHTIATKTDGSLWSWGYNSNGQLGDGSTTDRTSPTQVGTNTNWLRVAAGSGHTIAIKTDGSLWAWGYNGLGQLGDGSTTQKNSPTQIGADTNWLMISVGDSHDIAIKTDGSLWGWGNNNIGQLGDGTNKNIRISPIQIGIATNWLTVATGSYYSTSIKTDGSLWAWGDNKLGQLGDSTIINKTIPTAINCPSNIVLPVSYTTFVANKQGSSVLLNWQTANEVNNNYFTVQHSINVTSWVNIGSVNAGKGSYSFEHTAPINGTNYYRLQQVDNDGKSSLSEVRSINLTNANGKLSIYPNPIVGSSLVIDVAKDITKPANYSMYNALGAIVQQGTISQRQQTITINILAKGLYLLRLSDGQTASFIKQ